MKLHVKLSLSLVAGLAVVVGLAQIVQYFSALRHIRDLSEKTTNIIETREKEFADNIFKSIDRAVAGSLQRGEMDKFLKILDAQREVEGLIEFSLYNQKGIITHSTDPSRKMKTVPEELKEQLFTETSMVSRSAGNAIEIYQPQIITQECARCHRGWNVGEVGGVTSIKLSTESLAQARLQAEESISGAKSTFLLNSVFSLVGIVAVFLAAMYRSVNKYVRQPLYRVIHGLKDLSEGDGDLTKRLDIASKDELGELAGLFNTFLDKLHTMIKKVAEHAEALNSASIDLAAASKEIASSAAVVADQSSSAAIETEAASSDLRNMAAASEEVSVQVGVVASSSDEVSKNMEQVGNASESVSSNLTSVASAADQMSSSVSGVATAIEEMYATLNEVAKNAARGAMVTNDASDSAGETSGMVNILGGAAKEIGAVVELIKGIASQTNLLALNATIEAAGAGEAGKGFAVVANEVKELARQTAKATEEIRDKVESMQSNTTSAVKAIETIVRFITEINSIMSSIATAVEEQTATTNEISKSVSEAAIAANSVSQNVMSAAEAAAGTSQNVQDAVEAGKGVARNISEVAKGAQAIAQDAAHASERTQKVSDNVASVKDAGERTLQEAERTNAAVNDLAHVAGQLKEIVSQFKL